MSLERIARWCHRRRWIVLGIWVVALVGIQIGGASVGDEYATNFSIPGAESQHALDLLEQKFPQVSGDSATIVYRAAAGVTDPEVRSHMEDLFGAVAEIPHVVAIESPYQPEARSVSQDGTIAFATVRFDVQASELEVSDIEDLKTLVEQTRDPGLQAELGGEAVRFADVEGPGSREGIGLLAAVIILLISFGSLIAMGLPILTAVFGLSAAFGLITFLTHVVDIPQFAPQIASMIGLGVGIDYALFIVTRYRQGLHAGLEPADATAVAITTSGRAVIFAGGTVVISLAGMFLIGLQLIEGLAIGAMAAVVVAVIAALTLLPALLGFAGRSIDRLRIPWLHRDESAHRTSVWFRWSRFVQRNPWPLLLVALALLILLALPVFAIRLGVADAGSEPTSKGTRRAYDLLSEGFGPGFNGPFLVVAELSGPQDMAVVQGLAERISGTEGVAAVTPPIPNEAGDVALMTVFPTAAPQSEATEELLHRLRDVAVPSSTEGTGLQVSVGGVTAAFVDLSELLSRRLPWLILGVVALSFLLLMTVFRSIVIPVKAAILNLLSIGAAYGVLVAVFQWGWGNELVGIDRTGPIESFLPMMLFAILFGLSMDYEVFLLSRMREEYLRVGDNGIAVADGLATTARVITAAAAIMITLFLSFVLGDERIIKVAGLGLAVAILIDATIVRIVLVPAAMELLGEANWWLPEWLDRILPRIGFELESPEAQRVLEDELAGVSE